MPIVLHANSPHANCPSTVTNIMGCGHNNTELTDLPFMGNENLSIE